MLPLIKPTPLTTSSHEQLLALSYAIMQKKGRTAAFNALDSQDRARILRVLKISKFDWTTIEKKNLKGRVENEIQTMTKELQLFKAANNPTNPVRHKLHTVPTISSLRIKVHNAVILSEPQLLKKILATLPKDTAKIAVNSPDKDGFTPLMFCASSDNPSLQCLYLLLDAGADPTLKNHEGENFVHVAARLSQTALLKSFLNRFSKDKSFVKKLINIHDKDGFTPLISLALSDTPSLPCLHLLLDAGADPTLKNRWGENFVEVAANLSKVELLKSFLNRFSKDQSLCKKLINTPNKDGYTPLLELANSSNPSVTCMHLLLDAGADPTSKTREGENFVHVAAYRGQAELLKSFLKRFSKDKSFCKKLINAPNKEGQTPLLELANSRNPSVSCLHILLDSGADPTMKDRKGRNFVHNAAYFGQTELLKICLDRFSIDKAFCKKLINAPDKDGYTPLSECAYSHSPSIACLKLLLEAGAKLDFIPKDFAIYDPYFKLPNQKLARILLDKEPKIEGFFALNLVCHVFGFKPKSKVSGQSIHFAGSKAEIMSGQILADLRRPNVRERFFHFCRSDQYQELTRMFQKAAIEKPSAKQLVKEIRSKKLVLINGGWEEHAIALVFRDGYLVICNRGAGCSTLGGKYHTFFTRKIALKHISEEVIQKVLDLTKSSDKGKSVHSKAANYLYRELPKLLKAEKTPLCRKISKIQPKPSKEPVCAYASNKASLRAAFALLTKQVEKARIASKLWATHHREWSLNYFQQTPSFFGENFRKKIIKTQLKRLQARKDRLFYIQQKHLPAIPAPIASTMA